MKTLANILWHIPFLGFVSAISVYLFGLLLTITVVAAPIGLGYMELGKFLFCPFGNVMVSKSKLNVEQNAAWKTYGTIVRILFIPFGLLFFLAGLCQAIALFMTIIGIPVALVVIKSLGTYWNPVNKKCVPAAVIADIERHKG